MVEESDGIEEAFEGQLRVLVTAAGRIAERVAREREEALRRAQTRSEQETRELRSRLEAEQRVARAELGNVNRSEWWNRASPEQISHAYQVARAWGNEDPEAARAEQHMRAELRTRYGVDVEAAHADPAAVAAAVERAQQEQTRDAAERHRAAGEAAEAQRLLTQADQEDQRVAEARAAAEREPEQAEQARAVVEAEQREALADRAREDGRAIYDSAERRDGMARELEAQGIDHELVATRIRADISQATPATEAVRTGGRRAIPRARATRRYSRIIQAQRTGLGR